MAERGSRARKGDEVSESALTALAAPTRARQQPPRRAIAAGRAARAADVRAAAARGLSRRATESQQQAAALALTNSIILTRARDRPAGAALRSHTDPTRPRRRCAKQTDPPELRGRR